MAWIILALRRLRDDPVPSLVLGGLILMSAFTAAGALVLLGRVADDALRREIAAAAPVNANLELAQVARIPAGPSAPLGAVHDTGSRLLEELPAQVRSIVADQVTVIETPRWAVTSDTGAGTLLAIRVQEGAGSHVRILEGRAPTARTEVVDAPGDGPASSPVVAFEAMIAAPSARRMRVGPGDILLLGPDLTDPLARGRQLGLAVRLVGMFDVIDPGAPFWLDDRTVAGPGMRSPNADRVLIDVTVLVSADAYPALLAATDEAVVNGAAQPALPFRYRWRCFVDPTRVSAATAPGLLADLRRAETIFPGGPMAGSAQGGGMTDAATSLATGMPRVLAAQLDAWRSASAVLTVAAAGPAGIAVAALALVAVLSATRRRLTLATWYGRGARDRQVLAAVLAEALLVGLPAAAAGVAGARLVTAGDGGWPAIGLGAAVLAISVVLVAGATLAVASEPVGSGHEPHTPTRRRRRRVIEALVVVLAVAATVGIRERGVAPVDGGVFGIDPLAAAAPILVGLAVAVVSARAITPGLLVMAAAAARRRGLVAVLALRRSTRTGGTVVLAVLLTSAAIASFSLAGVDQLARAARDAAWQAVGADYLVTGAGGGPLAEPGAARSGVEALVHGEVVAAAYRQVVPIGPVGDQADLLALDPEYARVVSGTRIDSLSLRAVLTASGSPDTDALPAIVSSKVTIARSPITVGDTVELFVRSRTVPVRVVAVAESFPSLPAGDPFVVISLPALEQAVSARLALSRAYVRAPVEADEALHGEVEAAFPDATVGGRAGLEAALVDLPLQRAVSAGLMVAAIAAIAYAALAIVVALALSGAARASETAHLGALGVSRRQQAELMLLEHVPTVGLGYAIGLATGFAFFVAVLPGLRLGSVVGAAGEGAPPVDAGRVLVLLGAMTAVTAVAVLVGTFLERRASPAAASRRGVE